MSDSPVPSIAQRGEVVGSGATPPRVILCIAAYTSAYLPAYLLPHAVTAYLQIDGLTQSQAGVLSLLESGALAGMNLFAVMLPARLRPRLLLAACLLAVAANVISMHPTPFLILCVLRATCGAAFGLGGFCAAQQLASSSAPARVFGMANGVLALAGGMLLWLGPELPGDYAFQVFVMLAAAAGLLAIVSVSPAMQTEREAGPRGPSRLGRNPLVIAMIISTSLMFCTLGGLYDFAAYQGLELGMTATVIGFTLGWTTVTGLIGGPVGGWICARWGTTPAMITTATMSAATCLAVGSAGNSIGFELAFCLFGLTYMFSVTTVASIGAAADASGRTSALLLGCQTLAVAVGSLIVGILLEGGQKQFIGWFGSVLCLSAGLPGVWVARRLAGIPTRDADVLH